MALKLKIITPKGIFFDDFINIVTVKTSEGYIGILENHIPLVANLEIAKIYIKKDKKTYQLLLSAGILYSNKKEVKILTDYVEYSEKAKNNLVKLSKERHNKITKINKL